MTNSEMIAKLEQAQALMRDVYDWAALPMSNGLQVSPLQTNATIAKALLTADLCIEDCLDELEDLE